MMKMNVKLRLLAHSDEILELEMTYTYFFIRMCFSDTQLSDC